MKVERGENEIRWSYMFTTYTIPLLPDTEFMYSTKDKLIYVKNIVNNQLHIVAYNLRGGIADQRTYSHYFVNFFEKDGYVCMKYYDYSMQSYCTATFQRSAGINGITRVNG